jgi:hypothetical protein
MAFKVSKEGFYASKGKVWASYKMSGVVGLPKPDIARMNAELKDGRAVQFFVNRENNLVVVDVINKDEKGGNEILRKTV